MLRTTEVLGLRGGESMLAREPVPADGQLSPKDCWSRRLPRWVSWQGDGGSQTQCVICKTLARETAWWGNEGEECVSSFKMGPVTLDVLDGRHPIMVVPPSEWHGNRAKRSAHALLANLRADDGLRAQVSLVRWDDSAEISLGFAELLAGPSDYERLEDAGVISPKLVDDKLVARIRALRYGTTGRATGAAVEWSQISEWAGGDAQGMLADLGATRTGAYGVLLPSATRFKTEPAIEVPLSDPAALFGVYALTRVVPIMTGYGKESVEGPNA